MSAYEGLRIPRELGCPYYWGVGKCAYGCWTEPSCQTDEPIGGWKIRDSKGRFITKEREAAVFADLRVEAGRTS